MSNKTYDIMKFLTLRVLPPLLAFIGLILNELEYENVEIVMIIGTGFITMLGQILGISNDRYNKTKLIEEYDQEEENSLEFETNEEGD